MKINIPWIPIFEFVNPPEAPEGYTTEVERDCHLGFVISYRHVPIRKKNED